MTPRVPACEVSVTDHDRRAIAGVGAPLVTFNGISCKFPPRPEALGSAVPGLSFERLGAHLGAPERARQPPFARSLSQPRRRSEDLAQQDRLPEPGRASQRFNDRGRSAVPQPSGRAPHDAALATPSLGDRRRSATLGGGSDRVRRARRRPGAGALGVARRTRRGCALRSRALRSLCRLSADRTIHRFGVRLVSSNVAAGALRAARGQPALFVERSSESSRHRVGIAAPRGGAASSVFAALGSDIARDAEGAFVRGSSGPATLRAGTAPRS